MATLHIETTPENKTAWVRAAQAAPAKDGPGLAPWVIEQLNAAARAALNSDHPAHANASAVAYPDPISASE